MFSGTDRRQYTLSKHPEDKTPSETPALATMEITWHHLIAEQFGLLTNSQFVHTPYQGGQLKKLVA